MKMMWMKKIIICASILMLALIGPLACREEESLSGTYTIKVLSESGKPLEEVGVYVYKDASQKDLVIAGKTNEEGLFSFESESSVGDYVYLKDVPKGYETTGHYEISSQNVQITLETELIPEEELEGVTFRLGDVFADASFVSPEGTTYQISELLEEKKAVVLNFWFLNCDPCKMEFPYLDEAYKEYSDILEVIAVNPVDGTDATISEFQKQEGLTFPMVAGDMNWEKYMNITAYPTTVVIDRYGTVAMIHKGMITETEIFQKIFDYFTAEDYEQTTIKRLSDLDK